MQGKVEGLRDEIRIAREVAFLGQQEPKDYVVFRGVEPTSLYAPPWKVYGYRQALLRLEGLDVMEYIQKIIDRKGKARVLDVGCGGARFLYQCKTGYVRHSDGLFVQGWNDKVECYGLTSCLYRFLGLKNIFRDTRSDEEQYREAGIQIRIEDAQNLARLYQGQLFDVITAVHVAHHVADPWAMFYGMHEKLTEEGGCFVKGIPFDFVREEGRAMVGRLREKNDAVVSESYLDSEYSERYIDISMKKRMGEELLLPLEYRGLTHGYSGPKVLYRFDPTVAFQPILSGSDRISPER